MKSLLILSTLTVLPSLVAAQWYPNDERGDMPLAMRGYNIGQDIPIECIKRNIDKNGEHMFDDKDKIIYEPFLTCKETQKPFSMAFGTDQDINCTFTFSDELYHLFQIYIHEDAPFSCRIPLSSEPYSIESGGAYVPLTFNFRGELHDSHLDIDSTMNLLAVESKKGLESTVISAVAWSSGTNATRIVIGDDLTLNLGIRWVKNLAPVFSNAGKNGACPYVDGFYRLPKGFLSISSGWLYYYIVMSGLICSTLTFFFVQRANKSTKIKFKPYDSESDFTKRD